MTYSLAAQPASPRRVFRLHILSFPMMSTRLGVGAAHGTGGRGAHQDGFTLMELIIVLAALAALAAALAPSAFSYLRDAHRTQAQGDASRVANAVGRFTKDTALSPYKNNTSALKVGAKQAGDFDCLYASQGQEVTAALDGTAGGTWTSAGGVQCQSGSSTRDTIENHLIANTPAGSATKAYVTSGKHAWRGPYLASVPVDPWGNAYLVNIGKGDPAAAPRKAVWVISAGPNGTFETNSDAASASLVTAAGDDIIARIE